MAGNSKPKHSRFPEDKPVVAYNSQPAKISTVALQSQFPAHLKYIGLSGKEYNWNKAGDVVRVLAEDAPLLLAKRIGNRGCCGANNEGGNILFVEYKEAVNA